MNEDIKYHELNERWAKRAYEINMSWYEKCKKQTDEAILLAFFVGGLCFICGVLVGLLF